MKRQSFLLIALLAFSGVAAESPSLRQALDRGEQLVEEGDFEEAVAHYRRLLRTGRYPRDREKIQEHLLRTKKAYYVELIRLASASPGDRERLQFLLRARDLDVEDRAERGFLGYRGLNQRLKDATESAERLEVDLFHRLIQDAQRLVERRQYAEAFALYDEAGRLDPGLFLVADLGEGYQEAHRVFQEVERLTNRADRLIGYRRYAEARGTLQEARQLYPDSEVVSRGFSTIRSHEQLYQSHYSEASRAASEGDPESAIRAYRQARDIHPENAREHNVDRSIHRLEALILNEKERAGLLDMTREALDEGRAAAARGLLRQWLEEHREDHDVRKQLSTMLVTHGRDEVARGRYRQADSAFREALDLDAQNDEALRLSEAAKAFKTAHQRARRIHTDADCSARIKDLDKTLERARQLDAFRYRWYGLEALRDCPPEPLPIDRVKAALSSLLQGEASEAARAFEALIGSAAGKENPHLQAYLGVAYLKLYLQAGGVSDALSQAAKRSFAAALAMSPDYRLSARLFSPVEIEFFNQVRHELSQATLSAEQED